jgi:hypothetical protein
LRPPQFADATAAGTALAVDHPHWHLVQKLAHAWELSATESLDAVRESLPAHFSARPMVYAGVPPSPTSLFALRNAVERQKKIDRR